MEDRSALKNILLLVALLFGGWLAWKILIGLVSTILSFAIPIAIVAAIGYVVYLNSSRKSLGGGRRTLP